MGRPQRSHGSAGRHPQGCLEHNRHLQMAGAWVAAPRLAAASLPGPALLCCLVADADADPDPDHLHTCSTLSRPRRSRRSATSGSWSTSRSPSGCATRTRYLARSTTPSTRRSPTTGRTRSRTSTSRVGTARVLQGQGGTAGGPVGLLLLHSLPPRYCSAIQSLAHLTSPHSLTHPHTHSLTHTFTHSLTHPPTHPVCSGGPAGVQGGPVCPQASAL